MRGTNRTAGGKGFRILDFPSGTNAMNANSDPVGERVQSAAGSARVGIEKTNDLRKHNASSNQGSEPSWLVPTILEKFIFPE